MQVCFFNYWSFNENVFFIFHLKYGKNIQFDINLKRLEVISIKTKKLL